ncbi:hypothetical protein Q4595_11035 [Wenyingzhuangia sp. 1_MG-2023]|nr:hypothetical protein [Wenyingzhuangia sp. 1_MG-2023]
MNVIQKIRKFFSNKNSLEKKIEILIAQNNKILKENNLPNKKLRTDFEIKNNKISKENSLSSEKLKSDKFKSINKSYKNITLPFNQNKKIIIDNREGKGKLYIE